MMTNVTKDNMLMPLHEVPVADTTLLNVLYSFWSQIWCIVKLELAKESRNGLVPTKGKQKC